MRCKSNKFHGKNDILLPFFCTFAVRLSKDSGNRSIRWWEHISYYLPFFSFLSAQHIVRRVTAWNSARPTKMPYDSLRPSTVCLRWWTKTTACLRTASLSTAELLSMKWSVISRTGGSLKSGFTRQHRPSGLLSETWCRWSRHLNRNIPFRKIMKMMAQLFSVADLLPQELADFSPSAFCRIEDAGPCYCNTALSITKTENLRSAFPFRLNGHEYPQTL